MSDAAASNDQPHALPADLSLAAAPVLKQALVAALADAPPCRIDGAAVATVSTAAIQVLLAAARQQAARGLAWRLVDPSPVLAQAITDLGLARDPAFSGAFHG
jgi:anti-anti-sigma regulatory factor